MKYLNNRRIDQILNEHYEKTDEENRLTKDKTHNIEFITTTKYIEKYLKEGDRILEVGAGTGIYSLYYANKGYQVDAVELVQKNIDILNSKITNNMNIKAIQGNAIDFVYNKKNINEE